LNAAIVSRSNTTSCSRISARGAAGFALEDRLQTWDDLAPDRREWIRVSR
jgi:hypothetical protein